MLWFLLGGLALLASGVVTAPLWWKAQKKNRLLGFSLCIFLVGLMGLGYWGSENRAPVVHWLKVKNELTPLADQLIAGKEFDHQQLEHIKVDDLVMVLQHRLQQHGTANGWLLLANIFDKLNAFDQAEIAYRKAQQLAPDRLEPALALLALRFKMKQGQLDVSDMMLMQNLLKSFPESRQLLVMYAMTAYRHQAYVQAIDVWEKLLKMTDPRNKNSIQLLTRSIANAQRELKQNKGG